MSNESFFRTDLISESYNALKMTGNFISEIKSDQYQIKWSIIAMHNALQCFMVLALRGTSDLTIIKQNKQNKNKDIFEILSNPDNKLDNFMCLFKKCKQDKYMIQYVNSRTFCDNSGNITLNVEMLNDTRNNFIHYFTSGLSIEVLACKSMLSHSLEVIDFLLNKSENFTYQFSDEQICDMNCMINSINETLKRLGI